MGRYAHMTPVLRQLHWLPIEARAQFKVLVMTYKALNSLGPGYLKERLRPYMPDRPLRSAGESLLREPSMKEIRRFIYGSAPVMNDKTPGMSFYNMSPRESLQYADILSLLLNFGWTWIGAVAMTSDNGERFLQMVVPLFSESGVCFAFIEKIPTPDLGMDMKSSIEKWAKICDNIRDSTANVLVADGESYSLTYFRWFPYLSEQKHVANTPIGKVMIVSAQVELTSFVFQRNWNTVFFHSTLSFRVQSNEFPGFQQFLNAQDPSSPKGDGFIRSFWQQAFSCVFPNPFLDNLDGNICTGEEKLEHLPGSFFEMSLTGHSYNVYNAVHVVAHALHAMSSSGLKNGGMVTRGGPMFQSHVQWQNYQHILALVFEVKEVNENPQLLPNLILGFHIYDSYYTAKWAYHATIQLISTLESFVPNYKCSVQNNLMAVIGGLDSEISLYIATLLDIYKIPQLHHFLRGLSFNNSAGDKVTLDQNGELVAGYDVINWIISSNQSFHRVKVWRMDAEASLEQAFTIKEDAITWHSWFNQWVFIWENWASVRNCRTNKAGDQDKVSEEIPMADQEMALARVTGVAVHCDSCNMFALLPQERQGYTCPRCKMVNLLEEEVRCLRAERAL
ncbi:Vomeronasal type-2 receptor 1 [Varanus komodoensis]|nr:Vomeronasal type-2 receptor 1 [Varanus komodoensis]